MARTYRECPACGKRSLSIATRCPGCGQEFPSQPVRWQGPLDAGRRRKVPALALVLPLVVGVLGLFVWRGVARHQGARVAAAEAPVALDTARAAASPAMPDSAPSADAVPRLARTWTKVHERRSPKSDVVAVLLPGDTVLADSLSNGWWRVALDRRVLGYVYARTLAGE